MIGSGLLLNLSSGQWFSAYKKAVPYSVRGGLLCAGRALFLLFLRGLRGLRLRGRGGLFRRLRLLRSRGRFFGRGLFFRGRGFFCGWLLCGRSLFRGLFGGGLFRLLRRGCFRLYLRQPPKLVVAVHVLPYLHTRAGWPAAMPAMSSTLPESMLFSFTKPPFTGCTAQSWLSLPR